MGYHSKEIVGRFEDALKSAKEKVAVGEDLRVRVSGSNSKMGAVSSVSLLPFLSCNKRCEETCAEKCYAAKIANLRPKVLEAYATNTALAILRPDVYWAGIDYYAKSVRYFRFHVGGDILNAEYFEHMVKVAVDNHHTEFMCFTKQYEIVNNYIDRNKTFPENLHILFSGWTNLIPDNPHNLPEAQVVERKGQPDPSWNICGGNCFGCACRGIGCWTAKPGETIAFHMH